MGEARFRLAHRVVEVEGDEPKDTSMPKGARSGDLSIPKGRLSVPENAGTEFSKKSLVLYMNITTLSEGPNALTPTALQEQKIFFETQLARLKRFKVYAMFNDGAYRLVKDLEDVGEIDYQDEETLPAADLNLNINISIQVEENVGRAVKGQAGETRMYYTYVTDVNLADGRTREMIEGHSFKETEYRSIYKIPGPGGKFRFRGGFDPTNAENVNKVLQQLGRRQLINMALWLGKKYPITCEVTGIRRSGKSGGLNQGANNGLRNDVQMIIWGDDGIAPLALAAASIEASADKSGFNIMRWNTDDEDAAYWIEDIKADPGMVRKNYQEKDEMALMATTWSMPFPKEWMEAE